MLTKHIWRCIVVLLSCALLWAALLWLLPASQTVRANPGSLFVTVSGSGTACSQAQPCGLQTALNRAVDGEVVYVGAGTYTGSGSAVITITKGITLYGGWNGATTGAVARDSLAYHSIVDGQGARRAVIITGTFACTLDGFTIQGGNGSVTPDPGWGGGIYCCGARCTLSNNVITGNTASTSASWGWGGGIAVRRAAGGAMIAGNRIESNTGATAARGGGAGMIVWQSPQSKITGNAVLSNTGSISNGRGVGGGMYIGQSSGTQVAGNVVEHNIAAQGKGQDFSGSGGGIYLESGEGLWVTNNTVRFNVANLADSVSGEGGGIFAGWMTGMVLATNTVESNIAHGATTGSGEGGGVEVYLSRGSLILANRVTRNTASLSTAGSAGGLWIGYGSSFTMTNNIVAGNHASNFGGGLVLQAYAGEPVTGTLQHNTFVANNAGSGNGKVAIQLFGAGSKLDSINDLFSTHSSALCVPAGNVVTIWRALFWNNSSGDLCLGSSAGMHNVIWQDPHLDSTYHLTAESHAIDRAEYAGVDIDIDGDPRPIGELYDIGADEYRASRQVYLPLVLRKK